MEIKGRENPLGINKIIRQINYIIYKYFFKKMEFIFNKQAKILMRVNNGRNF